MFGLGLTEILVTALLVVLLLYLIYGRGKAYNLPPGPTPLPVVGNILTFVLSKSAVVVKLTECVQSYGPIFTLHFGSTKAVVINNIQLANEALLTKPTDFAGRPKFYSVNILSEGGKGIVSADSGPIWRLQRKIASAALRKYLSGPQLEIRVHKSLSSILPQIEAKKGAFIPKDFMSLLVLNFISAFCFGKRENVTESRLLAELAIRSYRIQNEAASSYERDDPEMKMITSLADRFLEQLANGLPEDFIPVLRHLKLKRSQHFVATVDEFLQFVYGKYQEHQATFDEDNIRDFTDCLIAAENEAREAGEETELSKLTNTHFVQVVFDIFGAGLDTSRFTLYWAILHCCVWPEVQEKVHKEIIDNVGTSRMPGIDDKKQLCYTEATLYESMRMATVVPIGIPHCAMVDGQIGGYDVPKGTMVIINQRALHYDSSFWGDPKNFRPERFLDEDGSLAPKPENFLPFSMGRRVCLGEAVAKPELFMMLAGLLQKFKFSLAPGEKGSLEPTGGIVGNMPNPFKAVAEPRF